MSFTPNKQQIELIESICNGTATSVQIKELNDLLLDNPELQEFYLQRIQLHHLLKLKVENHLTYDAISTLRSIVDTPLSLTQPSLVEETNDNLKTFAILASLAASLLIAFSIGLFYDSSSGLATGSSTNPNPLVSSEDSKEPDQSVKVLAMQTELADGISITKHPETVYEWDEDRTLSGLVGDMIVKTQPWSNLLIENPFLNIESLGAEFGVSTDEHGVTGISVYRGEVKVTLDESLLGLPQEFQLTRQESLQVTPSGTVTSSIIGSANRFTDLRLKKNDKSPVIVNSSFEYPKLKSDNNRTASDWTLVAHPISNADQMEIEAGLASPTQSTNPLIGIVPSVSDGEQWAYLTARRYPNGRATFTSMHQQIGLLQNQKKYRIQLAIARSESDPNPKRPTEFSYSVSLYAGNAHDGPQYSLKTWNNPTVPIEGEIAHVSLEYQAPHTNEFREDDLFIVIRAIPSEETGYTQVFVDNISVETF